LSKSTFTILATSALSAAFALSLFALPAVAQTSPGTKAPKVEEKAPENLSRSIHHQLLVLPFYSVFDNITFSLDGRKVTLRGQVIRQTLRGHAENSVKSIEGVEVVVNTIEVLPASASDDELRRNIYRAIFEDASLARYAIPAVPPIHIIVKNGTVALEGTADTDADKVLAGRRAGTVVEVPLVRNNLIVRKSSSQEN
jgi:hyperosmotically inducible periplasmic protein